MARPPAKELTDLELEVMQVFWAQGDLTVADAQKALETAGLKRAYTTVGTLVRLLADKGFLQQVNDERPFIFRPLRSYEDVSGKLLKGLLQKVFHGSWKHMLVRLVEEETLSAKDRAALEALLKERRENKEGRK